MFLLHDLDYIPITGLLAKLPVILNFMAFTMQLRTAIYIKVVIQNCQLDPGSIGCITKGHTVYTLYRRIHALYIHTNF